MRFNLSLTRIKSSKEQFSSIELDECIQNSVRAIKLKPSPMKEKTAMESDEQQKLKISAKKQAEVVGSLASSTE